MNNFGKKPGKNIRKNGFITYMDWRRDAMCGLGALLYRRMGYPPNVSSDGSQCWPVGGRRERPVSLQPNGLTLLANRLDLRSR